MPRGYVKEVGYGNVEAGKWDIIWKPTRTDRAGLPAIIRCHGANALDMGARPTWPNDNILCAVLAEAGFTVVAGYMGSTGTGVTDTLDPWGSDTGMTAITNAMAFAAASTGASGTKAHLQGVSHGGCMIASYAEQFPAKVASLTGIIPFLDTAHEYATNAKGFQAGIGTAWGIATNGTGTLPPRADVLGNAAAIKTANIPGWLFYSTYDALIDTATIASFATASGLLPVSIDSNGSGHADGSIKQLGNWNGGSNYSALVAALKAIA